MEDARTILYLGKDHDFKTELEKFCRKYLKSNFDITVAEYTPNETFKEIIEKRPNIVLIDFIDIKDRRALLEEVILLKKYKKFKSILFVAIKPEASDKVDTPQIFSSGFQYCFIKGNEILRLFQDCFYIGLDEYTSFQTYARAKNVNRKMEIGFCSSFSMISQSKFILETDLEVETDSLKFRLPVVQNAQPRSFKVKWHKGAGFHFPMTDTYIMEFPYVGPWDEITEDSLQQETIETWLANHADGLNPHTNVIEVITNNPHHLVTLKKPDVELKCLLNISECVDFDSLHNQLSLRFPILIFHDLEDTDAGQNDLASLGTLINKIKTIEGYHPVVVSTSNPSNTEAVKKACQYTHIVSTGQKLSSEVFHLLSDSYVAKYRAKQTGEPVYLLSSDDPTRAIDILADVILTSLTEHEITFVFNGVLPMFTVLHLELPIDCYITIVPPYFELKKSTQGTHYMGFIHGVSETRLSTLRKFVNQLIFKRPDGDLTPEIIRDLIEQKEPTPQQLAESGGEETEKTQRPETKTFQRPEIKGKSKL